MSTNVLIFTNLMSVALFKAQYGSDGKLLLIKNLSHWRTSSYRNARNISVSYKVLKTLGINFEYLEPNEILDFVERHSANYIYELSILREFDYLNYKNKKQKLKLQGVITTNADILFILLRFYEVSLDILFIKEWILWKKFAYQFGIKKIIFPGFGNKHLTSNRNFVFVHQELLLKQFHDVLNSNCLDLNLKTIEKFDIVIGLTSANYKHLIPHIKFKIKEFLNSSGKLPLVLVKPHPNLSFDLKLLADFEESINFKTANSLLNLDLDKLAAVPLEFILLSQKICYIGDWSSALNNIARDKCLIVTIEEDKDLINRSYLVYRKLLASSWD